MYTRAILPMDEIVEAYQLEDHCVTTDTMLLKDMITDVIHYESAENRTVRLSSFIDRALSTEKEMEREQTFEIINRVEDIIESLAVDLNEHFLKYLGRPCTSFTRIEHRWLRDGSLFIEETT